MAVYKVTTLVDQTISGPYTEVRLVEAKTKTSAIAHVVKEAIAAELCTLADAMALAKQGIEIEQAASRVEK